MKLNILFFKILLSDIDILQHQNKYKAAIKYATSKATPRTPTTRRGNRSRPKRSVEAHEILPYDPFFFLRPVFTSATAGRTTKLSYDQLGQDSM